MMIEAFRFGPWCYEISVDVAENELAEGRAALGAIEDDDGSDLTRGPGVDVVETGDGILRSRLRHDDFVIARGDRGNLIVVLKGEIGKLRAESCDPSVRRDHVDVD